jgi:hypothetical protein
VLVSTATDIENYPVSCSAGLPHMQVMHSIFLTVVVKTKAMLLS